MDDETYVKADFQQMPGQNYYSVRKGRTVDDKFKKKKVNKYAEKYLIWQAICSCGMKSSIHVCKGTLNGQEYL